VSTDGATAATPDGITLLPGFDDFYRQTYARVLAYARLQAGDITDAEQATVDAYTEAASRWDRVSQYDNPEAYVRLIVRQRLTKTFRRWLREHSVAQQLSPPVPPADPELSAEVLAVLDFARRLPGRQRQILALHCQGYTSEEIAQELGVKPSTVRTHLERARIRLRDAFRMGQGPDGRRADDLVPAPRAATDSRPRDDLLLRSGAALHQAFAADAERMERLRAQIGAALAGKRRADR
jgi:RNA polymerase sigma-70 factor (ECF subfamily)